MAMKAPFREDTIDEWYVKEANVYAPVFNNYQGGPILNAGGNIGSFEHRYYEELGQPQIVTFEPEPDNFEILKVNCEGMKNVSLYQKAIAKEDGKANFYVNVKKNKGAHGLRPTRGRDVIEVETVSFAKILKVLRPEIIKMDIEFGEWLILDELTSLPDFVKGIAIEGHLQGEVENREIHSIRLYNYLKEHFEFMPVDPNWSTARTKAWLYMIVAHN